MKTWKIIVIAIASVIASATAAFLIIHRRVIAAWINDEELPELPAWHPGCHGGKKLPKCCDEKNVRTAVMKRSFLTAVSKETLPEE